MKPWDFLHEPVDLAVLDFHLLPNLGNDALVLHADPGDLDLEHFALLCEQGFFLPASGFQLDLEVVDHFAEHRILVEQVRVVLENSLQLVLQLLDQPRVVVQLRVLRLLLQLRRVDRRTVLRNVGLVHVLRVVLPVLRVRLLAAQMIRRRVKPARWAQCRHLLWFLFILIILSIIAVIDRYRYSGLLIKIKYSD